MRAVYLGGGEVAVREIPVPEPGPGEALLRLIAGGICNTDLELQRGYYGFEGIPGHEFVAEVVSAPSPGWAGRRVVGEINLACGACAWCERDLGRHCPNRTVLGIVRRPGAFQDYFTLPIENLHPVPDHVATEEAVFTEPLAAACEILDQTAIPAGTEVAVLGDGKLGLLIAQVLQLHGARVHLYGRHPEKMAIAAALGVEPHQAGSAKEAQYEYAVDATGSPSGLAEAIRTTRSRGTVILKSTIHGDVAFDAATVIVHEITMIGSRCGRFEPALALLGSGRIPVRKLIDRIYPLGEAPRAFSEAASRGAKKILLQP